jgi:hypothetical protein
MTQIKKKKTEPIIIVAIVIVSLFIIVFFSFWFLYFKALLYRGVHEVYYDTQANHVERIELIQGFETEIKAAYVIKAVVTLDKRDALLQSLSEMKYYSRFTGPWHPYGDCFLIHYTDGSSSFICRTGVARYDDEGQEIDMTYAPYLADEELFDSLWDALIEP